jgi:ATP-binding cassette subfamily F protein 3
MRLEQNERAREKQNLQRAHIQSFVDRFRYKASKARQAQSRLKMLERMEPIAEHSEGGRVTFNFPDPVPQLSPPLFSVLNATVGYDDKAVLSKLSIRLDEDDRVALLGANGNGKSTLMRLLAGRLKQMAGTLTTAPKLRVGYFAQHQTEELDMDATPVIELGRRLPDDKDVQLRSQLGRFGFSQQRADTKISNLSGGEKARLLFALMTCDKPHILLLDEPTNHLDVDSRQALIQAINSFAGAVVIVSHDPHVIELTADRFWLVADGGVTPFDGDMDAYRSLLLAGVKKTSKKVAAAVVEAAEVVETPPPPPPPPVDKREQRKKAAEQRQALAPLRKQVQRMEKNIAKFQAEKAEIEAKMADPDLYDGDSSTLVGLQKDLGWVSGQIAEAEEAWLGLQAELEEASATAD